MVRANAFDAIKFTLAAEGVEQEIEFTEKIISIEELEQLNKAQIFITLFIMFSGVAAPRSSASTLFGMPFI